MDANEHLEIEKEMKQPEFELLDAKPSASGLPKTVYALDKLWKITIYKYLYKAKMQYNINIERWL